MSLNDIIAAIEACLNRKLDVVRTPGRIFDVPVNVLEISRAKKVLGWSPRVTLQEGLLRTLNDLARNAALSHIDPL